MIGATSHRARSSGRAALALTNGPRLRRRQLRRPLVARHRSRRAPWLTESRGVDVLAPCLQRNEGVVRLATRSRRAPAFLGQFGIFCSYGRGRRRSRRRRPDPLMSKRTLPAGRSVACSAGSIACVLELRVDDFRFAQRDRRLAPKSDKKMVGRELHWHYRQKFRYRPAAMRWVSFDVTATEQTGSDRGIVAEEPRFRPQPWSGA